MYRNDEIWGQQTAVKQWILNILMQLASSSTPSGSSLSSGYSQLHAIVAENLLQELEVCNDPMKKALYQECRANGSISCPLKITLPELGSTSLLDRVQERSDVEGNLRMLKKQRTEERRRAVYVPTQAKDGLQAADYARFPLMERVQEFLESEQKVFLLLGDSGAGKSTFSRELELQLWQSYSTKTGRIPLHINLSTIERPEHDMIPKHLRKLDFTDHQIQEMKHHRTLILICDGYDKSQQTRNLYVSNKLNERGEWNAQMVINCRSEYVGADYRDRFQPRDRNSLLNSSLFREAVIAPFSSDQVHAYIEQYVSINEPTWKVEDYIDALDAVPSLKDLVHNPFLMAVSLDVLPRMVDLGQKISASRVTRVALYDLFIEHWLERSKKRLGEKDLSPQAKEEFERLSAEGFTRNGMGYLKKLAVAIYKEQGGHPVIEYSQSEDEGTWKDAFFRSKDKQLLHEACPLTRNEQEEHSNSRTGHGSSQ
ncbi:Transducin (beta)-like 1 X-linked receptor 1 [Mortierella sp. GBA43]|nr:Transducin (beta)-like 1 X-linked receptor 1 [Mortierella sp. GBA43]